MEPGPLPPHERTWRHPSELGPTRADVDPGHSTRTVATAIATGTLAVLLVGVFVVAVTPSAPRGPLTLSATTSPGTVAATAAASPSTADSAIGAGTVGEPSPGAGGPRTTRQAIGVAGQSIGLVSFSAMPNAVASTPPISLDGLDVAVEVPDDDDLVYLHTDAVTYRLDWHAVEHLTSAAVVPDGSVVFDEQGDVVAHVRRGDLVTIVDD